MDRSRILAIGVDKVTMEQALERCREMVQSGNPHLVVTPNAEIAYLATEDPELATVINGADLVLPDGVGVVIASRILGDPLPAKVAGADLATRLVADLATTNGRVFLLGARPEVVQEAARRLRERFPGLEIGCRDGFFAPTEESVVVECIRQFQPHALFVALGAPRQEKWLAANQPRLGVPLSMGVGGTIDMWAGVSPRAPQWMIKANLEWLYRIVKLGRYGRSLPPLAKFLLAVGARRLRGGHHAPRIDQ